MDGDAMTVTATANRKRSFLILRIQLWLVLALVVDFAAGAAFNVYRLAERSSDRLWARARMLRGMTRCADQLEEEWPGLRLVWWDVE
jgi:hypothetical protein